MSTIKSEYDYFNHNDVFKNRACPLWCYLRGSQRFCDTWTCINCTLVSLLIPLSIITFVLTCTTITPLIASYDKALCIYDNSTINYVPGTTDIINSVVKYNVHIISEADHVDIKKIIFPERQPDVVYDGISNCWILHNISNDDINYDILAERNKLIFDESDFSILLIIISVIIGIPIFWLIQTFIIRMINRYIYLVYKTRTNRELTHAAMPNTKYGTHKTRINNTISPNKLRKK